MILEPSLPIEQVHATLVDKIGRYFSNCNKRQAVVGLSGGIDSAVVYALAVEALGVDNVRGILMPSEYSSIHSVSDSVELVNNVGGRYDIIPIEKIYAAFMREMNGYFSIGEWFVAQENLQARIRGTIVMTYANRYDALLLNTSNKSELFMGYGTLYGDLCGAMMVIADLYKLQVYELAQEINAERLIIPLHTISKEPSAELKPDQKDTDTLPPYGVLDPVLHALHEEGIPADEVIAGGADAQLVERIIRVKAGAAFKVAQLPPILTVGEHPIAPAEKCL
ncbi:MAG: NAD(+) synthase [Bacteroidales bacterium]|nr:NAD(+) synthase [Bacteroidales bacterium]